MGQQNGVGFGVKMGKLIKSLSLSFYICKSEILVLHGVNDILNINGSQT